MIRYILKQIGSGLITVFFIATATFVAMHAVPGDPLLQGKAVTPEVRKNLEAKYGLDQPLLTQYSVFMKNMMKGDFGISFTQHNRSVNDIIREHFPISAILGVFAILIATGGGILYGSLTALYRNKWPDRIIMLFVILGVAVPSFVVATVMQLIVTELNRRFGLQLFAVAGWGGLTHMVLPALAL
ncbi:MAG: ABC transporter permease, partial [Bdellovibrionales bacterium]|nr:ABC transporter permease [Bdellovibrionales bacterium]